MFSNKNFLIKDNKNTLLNIVPNEDLLEIKNVIKLMLFTNNYNKYDINYIKKNYNLNSFEEFKLYFKKNFKKKLIFNSNKAERMFINFVNFDMEYFNNKYNDKVHQILLNFFIYGKKFYFSSCHEFNYNNSDIDKLHLKECNCKIKVKSINNLKITLFLDLINNKINTNKIIKIKNNSENKIMISCFNELKEIGKNLGISNDANYIIDSVMENNDLSIKSSDISYSSNSNSNKNKYLPKPQDKIYDKILNKITNLEQKLNNNTNYNIKSDTDNSLNSNPSNTSNSNNKNNKIITHDEMSIFNLKNMDNICTTEINIEYNKELDKYNKLNEIERLKKLNKEKKLLLSNSIKYSDEISLSSVNLEKLIKNDSLSNYSSIKHKNINNNESNLKSVNFKDIESTNIINNCNDINNKITNNNNQQSDNNNESIDNNNESIDNNNESIDNNNESNDNSDESNDNSDESNDNSDESDNDSNESNNNSDESDNDSNESNNNSDESDNNSEESDNNSNESDNNSEESDNNSEELNDDKINLSDSITIEKTKTENVINDIENMLKSCKKNEIEILELIDNFKEEISKNELITNKNNYQDIANIIIEKIKNTKLNKKFVDICNKIKKYNLIDNIIKSDEQYNIYYKIMTELNELREKIANNE
jgi:hypothetical protein